MSYLVIPVYDFACDQVLESGKACPHTIEVIPANLGTDRLLNKAHQLIRADGWRVVRLKGEASLHYCPEHAGGQS